MNMLVPELPDVTGDLSNAVVRLAEALINIESISGGEQAIAKALKSWLDRRGWNVQSQPVDAAREGEMPRVNLYARRPQCHAPEGPRVLLCTHLDTVPPFFSARIEGGIIHGRGACDTKGILAAMLIAAEKLVEAGHVDFGILLVVSEETDHSGIKRANDLHLKPTAFIVGEPTESRMVKLQKGMMKLRLRFEGVACHSGYPHLGKSAIDPMVEVLHRLLHTSWPEAADLGKTTLNVGVVSGGHADNALAAEAQATLMFRLTCPPQQVLDLVTDIVSPHGAKLEVITANPPTHLSTLEGFTTDVVSFNTDIPYFRLQASAKAYLIGPGSIHNAHSAHEQIKVAELVEALMYYEAIIKRLLQSA